MIQVIDWFEIPATDLDRAVAFYEAMLKRPLKRDTFHGVPQAMFTAGNDGAGGAIVQDQRLKPNPDGTLVYLNAGKDLDGCIERGVRAGGRVVLPKTDIGDPGFIAILADTEGNRVGLHMERAR